MAVAAEARRADESGAKRPGGPSGRTLADRVARRRRAAIAGHEGDAATARSFLVDDDPGVRATALGALARCGELRVAELEAGCADLSPMVRRRAAELLPGRRSVSILPLLNDADPIVVDAAAWAAGERHQDAGIASAGSDLGGPDLLDAVVEALADLATGHGDQLVREAAVAALGSIGADAGLPAVLDSLEGKVGVRRRAVVALASFDGPEVVEALTRALEDRDWQVRQIAEDLTQAPLRSACRTAW